MQTCDNASQCVLNILKVEDICARDANGGKMGIVELTSNEGASIVLGAVKCKT